MKANLENVKSIARNVNIDTWSGRLVDLLLYVIMCLLHFLLVFFFSLFSWEVDFVFSYVQILVFYISIVNVLNIVL